MRRPYMCHGKIAGIGQNLVLDSLWRAENGNLSVSVSWRRQAEEDRPMARTGAHMRGFGQGSVNEKWGYVQC